MTQVVRPPVLIHRVPGVGGLVPTFVLDFADLGAGEVSTIPTVGGVSPTFVRATTAWTKLSSGLWAQVASGIPRSGYLGANTATGSYAGYRAEDARTNTMLRARDLSVVATWTTATGSFNQAKDQVGIDGVSNSASSLEATAATSRLRQVVNGAVAEKLFSAFVKRITGTGGIDMSINGGVSFTSITSSINSSTYTRVGPPSTSIGQVLAEFRISTSGDKIAVDMAQLETTGTTTAFASSPIPTTTAAVTRNQDALTYPLTGWFNAAEGTLLCRASETSPASGNNRQWAGMDNDTQDEAYVIQEDTLGKIKFEVNDGAVNQVSLLPGTVLVNEVARKFAGAYKINDFAACEDGGTVLTDTIGTLPTVTKLYIGDTQTSLPSALFGHVSSFKYFNVRLADATLQGLTAP